MARKRMIDPSIWTDEGMAELEPRQQLLYIGLFSNADDDGRLKGSPAAVSLMLPTLYGGIGRQEIQDDIDAVCRVMRQLVPYTVDGRPFLSFRKYRQWQKIDRPTPSVLPPPPDESSTPRRTVDEPSSNDHGLLDPNRIEEKGTEEKEQKTDDRKRSPVDDSHPFALLEALCEVQGQETSVLTSRERGKQLAAGKRLIADGVTVEDVAGITRYLMTQHWRTTGIDLFTVAKEIGAWKLAGKPATAQAGSLTRLAGGRTDDPNINPATGKPYPYNHPKNPRSMVG